MPDIDPTDVLPVNNLPAPSAPWGRAMEKRLRALEKAVVFGDQDIAGQNRTTAAQLAAISEQLTDLSDAQQILAATVTRLNETSQTHVYPTLLSSNSSSWLGEYVIPKPAWADAALVSSSYVITGGSTTREVLLPVYVSNSPITSVGGATGMTSNGYFSGSDWFIHEPTTPIAVTLSPSQNVRIRPYRTIMSTGSGNLSVQIMYSVTFSTIL